MCLFSGASKIGDSIRPKLQINLSFNVTSISNKCDNVVGLRKSDNFIPDSELHSVVLSNQFVIDMMKLLLRSTVYSMTYA